MVDLFGPFCLHANVSFARPDALKASLFTGFVVEIVFFMFYGIFTVIGQISSPLVPQKDHKCGHIELNGQRIHDTSLYSMS